ncbi:hypothetical protein MMC18_002514 [Xylographa bjoerkii]|nr:hypothetical protein [Xylographa bjoerkii]
MAEQTYPITGISTGSRKPAPLRCEISSWWDLKNKEKNKYQVSLFIQALAKFETMKVEEKLSYFQIAGIHSYPSQPWDHAPGPTGQYCAHDTVIFPTWHRPYMALFEQRLHEIIMDIIGSWSGMTESQLAPWKDAAFMFRLPYWDWARKQTYVDNFALPQVFTVENVNIFLNDGTWRDLPNPLWKFQNPMGNVPMGDKKVMQDWAIQDNGSFPNTAGGQFMSVPDPKQKGYKGLGLGHMSDVPVAAFDPIFWLHHCNIDRQLAMFQTAQIAITIPLLILATQDVLGPLEPVAVGGVLKQGLKWVFVELGGEEKPPSSFPRTKIAVYSGTGQHPQDGAFLPNYGGYTLMPEATEGKLLGVGSGVDEMVFLESRENQEL